MGHPQLFLAGYGGALRPAPLTGLPRGRGLVGRCGVLGTRAVTFQPSGRPAAAAEATLEMDAGSLGTEVTGGLQPRTTGLGQASPSSGRQRSWPRPRVRATLLPSGRPSEPRQSPGLLLEPCLPAGGQQGADYLQAPPGPGAVAQEARTPGLTLGLDSRGVSQSPAPTPGGAQGPLRLSLLLALQTREASRKFSSGRGEPAVGASGKGQWARE